MRFSSKVVQACLLFRILVAFENPVGSRLLRTVQFTALTKKGHAVILDLCQFVTPRRKRTHIDWRNDGDTSSLRKRCTGKRCFCSKSTKHYLIFGWRQCKSTTVDFNCTIVSTKSCSCCMINPSWGLSIQRCA